MGPHRISSTITEHTVMALRHDLARSGANCSVTSRTSSTSSLNENQQSRPSRTGPDLVF
jgi:hypothetical protein